MRARTLRGLLWANVTRTLSSLRQPLSFGSKMKIISLQAENFQRLTAVSITPDGNIVELTGENGQGKTSILDAIWAALGGKDASPDMPVRKGEEVATIVLDLGELTVRRRFINKSDGDYTTTLTVQSEDGSKEQTPQTLLNSITERLTFDPLEFSLAKPAQQIETLKTFVSGFDFATVERQISDKEDERLLVGREVKANEKAAEVAEAGIPEDAPLEPIDEAGLHDALRKIEAKNRENADERIRRQKEGEQIDDLYLRSERIDQEITNLKKKIADLNIEAASLKSQAQRRKTALMSLPDVEQDADFAAASRELEAARTKNAAYEKRMYAHDLRQKAQDRVNVYTQLTIDINDLRKKVADAVANSRIPVTGMTFDSDGVWLNEAPFSQASQAEKLRASIAIAAALNPKLRIMRVREGALLSKTSMEALASFADAADFQIWVETVDSNRPTAIEIVDGAVNQNGEA